MIFWLFQLKSIDRFICFFSTYQRKKILHCWWFEHNFFDNLRQSSNIWKEHWKKFWDSNHFSWKSQRLVGRQSFRKSRMCRTFCLRNLQNWRNTQWHSIYAYDSHKVSSCWKPGFYSLTLSISDLSTVVQI